MVTPLKLSLLFQVSVHAFILFGATMDTSPRTSVEKLIQDPESPSLNESEGSQWAKERQHEGPGIRRRVLVISLMVVSFLINIALAIVVYNAPQGQSDAGQGRDEFTLPCTQLVL